MAETPTYERVTDLTLLTERLRRDARLVHAELAAPEQVLLMIDHAFQFGQRVVRNRAMNRRTCRICGCWELDPCEDGCAWTSPNLCTACEAP